MTDPVPANSGNNLPTVRTTCRDCGVFPGELHQPGCDLERCPSCGGQMISCNCIYTFNGIDPETMEDTHPDIYEHGPTEAMCEAWDKVWGSRRMRWTGEYPGADQAREFGWYCRMGAHGWEPCGPDDEGATEDMNRLVTEGRWNAETQRWEKDDQALVALARALVSVGITHSLNDVLTVGRASLRPSAQHKAMEDWSLLDVADQSAVAEAQIVMFRDEDWVMIAKNRLGDTHVHPVQMK